MYVLDITSHVDTSLSIPYGSKYFLRRYFSPQIVPKCIQSSYLDP